MPSVSLLHPLWICAYDGKFVNIYYIENEIKVYLLDLLCLMSSVVRTLPECTTLQLTLMFFISLAVINLLFDCLENLKNFAFILVFIID